MPACNKGNRFFVIHGHAPEGLTDIAGGQQGIRVAVGALRVYINKAHLNSSQGIFQLPVPRITLVFEPFAFRTPVDVLQGLPYIFPSSGKTKGLESHGFQGNVTRQDHQVGPRDFPPVFLFYGPYQATRLIEVGIVGPAVKGSKPL